MKGLPMKIGQILSYMEGVVPAEYRDTYRDALAALRTTSPAMSREESTRVITDELGAAPEELFDEFDWEPLAAASIGQVYAARFDGRAVCVKVQYPGIADAVESDLKNVDSIVSMMRRVVPNIDVEQMIEAFRARLAEECDYRQEADYQRRFAEIYADDPELRIPEVMADRSARRVLTTERLTGEDLDALVADAPPAQRNDAGRALFRFAFGSLLRHGLFHSDPHPGNLLFRSDAAGRLGVLDYGCVQPVPEEACTDMRALFEAALAGDDLAEPTERALGLDDVDEATHEAIARIASMVLAPITRDQPFRFTRDLAVDIGRAVVRAKADLATRYLTRRGRFVARREGVMFVVRNLFGLASIWGALEAEGDYRELAAGLLSP